MIASTNLNHLESDQLESAPLKTTNDFANEASAVRSYASALRPFPTSGSQRAKQSSPLDAVRPKQKQEEQRTSAAEATQPEW